MTLGNMRDLGVKRLTATAFHLFHLFHEAVAGQALMRSILSQPSPPHRWASDGLVSMEVVVPITLRGVMGVTGARRSGPCSLEAGARREPSSIAPTRWLRQLTFGVGAWGKLPHWPPPPSARARTRRPR
jgi:hypothetical protein